MVFTKGLNKQIRVIVTLIASLIALGGCEISQSAGSSESITRQECEQDQAFVYVPAGEFILGSDRQEQDFAYSISAQAIADTESEITQAEQKLRATGWFDREASRKTFSLPAVCIGRNLVTNQEYQQFIQATDHQSPGISAAEYQKQGFLVHPYSKVQDFLWQDGQYPTGKEQHPVVLISYEDALAYALWYGAQTGATYRLPTAKEWEKAARGEDGRYFPWGNNWLDEATNTGVSGLDYTNAIATFPLSKSVYGVEDMAGNVFEYTSTLQWQGTRSVMKGCSWDDLPGFCRAAYQHTRPVNSRHILFGFRLVREE
ncbi:SUMF1/EgtB/PvdO family nonheme iron enzyme [Pleurocapsa sp. PCC 7319]|uniref:formylglycine-generating enzyme family protein n=1 Tax=Pleurocapsa sp. PCC 7319 TaxID=118161 RepID=UPI00036B585D|nr:SUMF1/EgtB/PvdO family nonheme iron enzyme [Pleurocapsa sp. PCC 7319]